MKERVVPEISSEKRRTMLSASASGRPRPDATQTEALLRVV